MTLIGDDIEKAVELLNQGEVVAIPTETVYGLAANALDEKAVVKIFEAKNRPFFNPLILHIHHTGQLSDYVVEVPALAEKLIQAFWPGPLTLLLPKKDIVPSLVTAGSELVAIRNPNQSLTLQVLGQLDYPLAAPSANPFGYISPVNAQHVFNQLSDKIPYILDGGECEVGLESTIVGFDEDNVLVYRLGGISIEELERVAGRKVKLVNESTNSPQTSGMLKSHYSPSKELILHESYSKDQIREGDALLVFGEYNLDFPKEQQYNLSEASDLSEAAMHLFTLLHQLDGTHYQRIIAWLLPESGLGRAINDRLKRASSNY